MQRGFSLVETVIAAGLLVAAGVTLAQVLAMSVHSGFSARTRTVSTLLAARKMEELKALPWTAIATPAGEAFEYFDGHGARVCGESQTPCAAATYACRWSASAAPFNAGVLIIDVHVGRIGTGANGATLTTARARRTP